ncbi:MAG TPA: HEAT repeat domain-containing protein [Thermoanaerobaculia bacterium]|jgi:hypothetical protein
MALFFATCTALAIGTYAVPFRLRRPVRLLLALAVFFVLGVLPVALLLLFPDDAAPRARVVERWEIDHPAGPEDVDRRDRILRQLRSNNRQEVRSGLANVEQMKVLPPAIVDQLIVELGKPMYGMQLINDTLIAGDNAVARVLARHPEAAEPLRVALARHESPRVRRFAARILGEMRYAPALPELRQAIVTSLETPIIEDARATEADPRAMLTAAVEAHARIDSVGVTELLVSFARDRRSSTRLLAAESLSRVIRAGAGRGRCSVEAIESGECGVRWQRWWSRAKHRPEEELFRWHDQPAAPLTSP